MIDPFAGQRQADQATTKLGHKVHRIRRCHLGWNNQIALVLAVFGIHQNDHPAIAHVINDFSR